MPLGERMIGISHQVPYSSPMAGESKRPIVVSKMVRVWPFEWPIWKKQTESRKLRLWRLLLKLVPRGRPGSESLEPCQASPPILAHRLKKKSFHPKSRPQGPRLRLYEVFKPRTCTSTTTLHTYFVCSNCPLFSFIVLKDVPVGSCGG